MDVDGHSDQRSQGETEPYEMGSDGRNDSATTTTVYGSFSEGAMPLVKLQMTLIRSV